MRFDILENGIKYYNVSNLDSVAIEKTEEHCVKLLSKINKIYEYFEGTRDTITFVCKLTEEEVELLEE